MLFKIIPLTFPPKYRTCDTFQTIIFQIIQAVPRVIYSPLLQELISFQTDSLLLLLMSRDPNCQTFGLWTSWYFIR